MKKDQKNESWQGELAPHSALPGSNLHEWGGKKQLYVEGARGELLCEGVWEAGGPTPLYTADSGAESSLTAVLLSQLGPG